MSKKFRFFTTFLIDMEQQKWDHFIPAENWKSYAINLEVSVFHVLMYYLN